MKKILEFLKPSNIRKMHIQDLEEFMQYTDSDYKFGVNTIGLTQSVAALGIWVTSLDANEIPRNLLFQSFFIALLICLSFSVQYKVGVKPRYNYFLVDFLVISNYVILWIKQLTHTFRLDTLLFALPIGYLVYVVYWYLKSRHNIKNGTFLNNEECKRVLKKWKAKQGEDIRWKE